MSVASASLLQLLNELEQQVHAAPGYTEALRTALESHGVRDHCHAKLDADHQLDATTQSTQDAIRRLGRESNAARFLHDGRALRDWPELSTVCARMLAATQVRIDADPNLPLLVYAQPSSDRRAREIKP